MQDFNSNLKTKKEAAIYMRISLPTLSRLLSANCIPYIKLGARVLIQQADIDTYLAQCRVESVQPEQATA